MSPNVKEYLRLLRHMMGCLDSVEHELVGEQLDRIWYNMTEEEQEQADAVKL